MATITHQASVLPSMPVSGGGTQSNEFQAAIKSVTSSTDVGAVFLYDTSQDSDPSWRKRCKGLSWFDEASSATRSARKDFPAMALIVADTSAGVSVYDLDDPSVPLWMKFTLNTSYWHNYTASSVYALNGVLCIGQTPYDLVRVNFPDDNGIIYAAAAYQKMSIGNIADRNTTGFHSTSVGSGLADRDVNDVAMTVLEGAELGALGLPIPTVAVATGAGTSVIHANGDVYDVDGGGNYHKNVDWDDDNTLFMQLSSNSTHTNLRVERKLLGQLYADSVLANDSLVLNLTNSVWTATGAALGVSQTAFSNAGKNTFAQGGPSGLQIWKRTVGFDALNTAEPPNLNAYITSTYNTGYMLGDIRLALAETRTTPLYSTNQVVDRCVKAKVISVNGTITNSVVDTSAELSAYSGFSASNYLSRAADTDFDFGTGDFSIMGWAKFSSDASSGSMTIFDRAYYTSGAYSGAAINLRVDVSNDEKFKLEITDDAYSTTDAVSSTSTPEADASWHQFVALRRGSNIEMFVDGRYEARTAISAAAGSLSNGNATVTIGLRAALNQPLDNGSLSLLRISATAPTPQQIKEIYDAEKPLFAANAKCLLAANQVNDLAYDKTSGLLHVASESTASSKSFRGLEAVESLTSDGSLGLTAATEVDGITAAGGVLAAYDNAKVGVNLPSLDVRAELNEGEDKLPDDGKLHFEGVTTDATPTVIGFIPIAENEWYSVRARVTSIKHNSVGHNRFHTTTIEETFYRETGGDITSRGQISKLTDEVTAFLDFDLTTTTGGSDSPASITASANYIMLRVTGYSSVNMVWKASVEVQRISEKQYER